jgi:hypothetical protein
MTQAVIVAALTDSDAAWTLEYHILCSGTMRGRKQPDG